MTMVLLIDFLRCWLFQCILPSLSRTYHGMTLPYHDYPPPSYQQKMNTFNAQAAASIVVIAIIVDVFRVHRQDEIRTTPPGLQIKSQDVSTMDSGVSNGHCILYYWRRRGFIYRNILHKAKRRGYVAFIFNCFVQKYFNVSHYFRCSHVDLTWIKLSCLELTCIDSMHIFFY